MVISKNSQSILADKTSQEVSKRFWEVQTSHGMNVNSRNRAPSSLRHHFSSDMFDDHFV